jgi:predicted dehydrogenase
MKFLIIGYGSIGKRHVRNLLSLGHQVVLLRHDRIHPNSEGHLEYYSLDDLSTAHEEIDGAIICSPTSKHVSDAEWLIRHDIPFFLEKPPAADLTSATAMMSTIRNKGFDAYDIGYNLRYHPIIKFLKNFISNLGKIYTANIYVGYYLPYWRPGTDYRYTSSAKKELGGGVHVELAHDIDYALWLLGYPDKLVAFTEKVSSLEISTKDICAAILRYNDGSILEIHLDYLSHKYLRGGRLIGEEGTLMWEWDLGSGSVSFCKKGDKQYTEMFSVEPNYDLNNTYMLEIINFIHIVKGSGKTTVDMDCAMQTMKIIDAIERSSQEGRVISLNAYREV